MVIPAVPYSIACGVFDRTLFTLFRHPAFDTSRTLVTMLQLVVVTGRVVRDLGDPSSTVQNATTGVRGCFVVLNQSSLRTIGPVVSVSHFSEIAIQLCVLIELDLTGTGHYSIRGYGRLFPLRIRVAALHSGRNLEGLLGKRQHVQFERDA
eukprot:4509064-Amphidinium_carterae.2